MFICHAGAGKQTHKDGRSIFFFFISQTAADRHQKQAVEGTDLEDGGVDNLLEEHCLKYCISKLGMCDEKDSCLLRMGYDECLKVAEGE